MSDEVVVEVPDSVYNDEETEVFVDETPDQGEQSKLIEELRAKQAELQAKVDPVEALKTAVQGLGGQLKPAETKPDVSVRPNVGVQDWKQYENDFNTKVFENPFAAITDIVSKATEMQSASVANQNLAYSRRIVQIDPATKDHYSRWANEVEAEVAKMPVSVRASNPNVYEDALRVVKANHLDELIAEKISASQGAAPQANKAPAQYAEGSKVAPAATQAARKQVRVSQTKMNEINSYAEQWGIPVEAAVRLYQQRGQL